MRRLGAQSIDVVVTSPPYNIGKNYREYDDNRSAVSYLRWMGRVARGIHRTLADDGSLFLNLGSRPSEPSWPLRVLREFTNEFRLQNTILWVKSIVLDADETDSETVIRGHYKPVNSQRFLSGTAEYVFHLTKRGDVPLEKLSVGTPYKDKSNVSRWGDDEVDLRDRGSVWFIPYGTIHRERAHPCAFPPKLPRMCIKLHGLRRTHLVLDPFVGTGSSAVAAAQLGVGFIGFDIDPFYAKLAQIAIAEAELDEKEAVAAQAAART